MFKKTLTLSKNIKPGQCNKSLITDSAGLMYHATVSTCVTQLIFMCLN